MRNRTWLAAAIGLFLLTPSGDSAAGDRKGTSFDFATFREKQRTRNMCSDLTRKIDRKEGQVARQERQIARKEAQIARKETQAAALAANWQTQGCSGLGAATGCAETDASGNCICPSNCRENHPNQWPGSTAGCGATALRCGGNSNEANNIESVLQNNGACSPFWFQPRMQQPGCANPVPEIAQNADPPKIWKSTGADNVWVFHGCDGAGIQTDCWGDILYLEQFGTTPITQPGCGTQPYPGHNPTLNPCPFFHPGNPPVKSEYYNAGLWNGGPRSSESLGEFKSAPWLLGVAGPGSVDHLFRHCVGCTAADGLWENTFWNVEAGSPAALPEKLVAGTVNPWICVTDNDPNMTPYTGSADKNCYYDNEPWNGRHWLADGTYNGCGPNGGEVCEPNWSTAYLYCGLYRNNGTPFLLCDQFSITPCDGDAANKCWTPTDTNHGFSYKEKGGFILNLQ